MINLIHGKRVVVASNPTNSYKFVFKFMHGDADGYDTRIIIVNEDNPFLNQFLEDLSQLKSENTDCYDSVIGKWVDGSEDNPSNHYQNKEAEKKDLIAIEWPYDMTCEDSYASFQYFRISYFDESGTEYEVGMNKE